ncbi:hypothetical protein SESBI_01596 [Sesbania bispinosa]|nr:hypothetical protein SESBI_01596 [Sesbania bispinosa]
MDVLPHSIPLRMVMSFIALVLLFWTISKGHQIASESKGRSWIACIGALIMLGGFYLLTQGIEIAVDLVIRLSEEEEDDCSDPEDLSP